MKMAKTESCETVQAKMQARLEQVRIRKAERTEFAKVGLQGVRGSGEHYGRDRQDAVCLIDVMGVIAKKSRLNPRKGLEPAGAAG